VLAPDLFRIPEWATQIPPSLASRIWIDMGDHDTLRFDLAGLKGVLDRSGIVYQAHTYPGEHTSTYWSAHLESYLRWYDQGW
jgi:enterochelin esterase-like enzyme